MSLQQKLERMKTLNVSDDYKQALDDVISILDQEEKCYCQQWNMPKIRPELKEFMLACEAELQRHDAEKGDSWKTMTIEELITIFTDAINDICKDNDDYVDIANLAMMLWWRSKDV